MRLLVHVEGPTEELFVNQILSEELRNKGFESVKARRVGDVRQRNRGGIRQWDSVRREIHAHLADDTAAYATTMVDYYALPPSWPGRPDAPSRPVAERARYVEEAVLTDFSAFSHTGGRFLPFVTLHEFEGLLFSDCEALALSLDAEHIQGQLQDIRDAYDSPEHINDNYETAPSRRIVNLLPSYEKVLFGNMAALEMGIKAIRDECPHFAYWLDRLEALTAS